jgi:hypothetical protein
METINTYVQWDSIVRIVQSWRRNEKWIVQVDLFQSEMFFLLNKTKLPTCNFFLSNFYWRK